MAVIVRPGDTIFIPFDLTYALPEDMDRVASAYSDAMEGVTVYLTAAKETIVYRPDGEEEGA